MVVWELVMDPAHLGGIIVVPPVKLLGRYRVRLLITARQRLDQAPLDPRRQVESLAREADMREGERSNGRRFGCAKIAPGQIVERPGRVCDSPVGHQAVRVRLKRLPEALDALLLIESVAPVKPEVEPLLCLE